MKCHFCSLIPLCICLTFTSFVFVCVHVKLFLQAEIIYFLPLLHCIFKELSLIPIYENSANALIFYDSKLA